MKKWICTLIGLFFPLYLQALPVGNPWDPSLLQKGLFFQCFDTFSFRIGFYGDYVFNRRTRCDHEDSTGTVRKTKLCTNAGYVAFNLFDRIDVFGTIGTTNIKIIGHAQNLAFFSGFNTPITLDSDTGFSWSAGARVSICRWKWFLLGAEGQYFKTRPELKSSIVGNGAPLTFFTDRFIDYEEWQAGLGLSLTLCLPCDLSLYPYVAAKYSDVHIDMGEATIPFFSNRPIPELKNQFYTGYVIGATLVGCEIWSLTAEGRFMDELAFYFNGQVRF